MDVRSVQWSWGWVMYDSKSAHGSSSKLRSVRHLRENNIVSVVVDSDVRHCRLASLMAAVVMMATRL